MHTDNPDASFDETEDCKLASDVNCLGTAQHDPQTDLQQDK